MEHGRWEEAVSLLDKAIDIDPFDENQYLLILRCFQEIKDLKRAKRYYTRLEDTLREELDVTPSEEVAAAYRFCLDTCAGRRRMAAI